MNLQKVILKKSKKFILDGHKNNKNVSFNPNYFLSSWSDSIGYINLKRFSKTKYSLLKKYKIIFKEFFSINKEILYFKKDIIPRNYKKLVLSYFYPESLKRDGSYEDRYFGVSSDYDKSIFWVLIPLNKINKKIKTKKNIILLEKKIRNFYINFFFSIVVFLKYFLLNFCFFNIEKIKFKNSTFSKSLLDILDKIVLKNKINNLIFPYEAQPHQHYFTDKLKKKNKKLKIIGYMHTVIPPLPVDYIKRQGHPDMIYVNGIGQKNIFCNKLGWKKNEVQSITSLRYKKKIKKSLNKNIIFPYFIEDEEKLFYYFQKLILSKKLNFFPKLKVKNHPAMNTSKKHLRLIEKLNNFLKKNNKLFKNTNKNDNICICFGSTAAVAECLERGYQVFHICCDPILEKLDSFYWIDVKVFMLNFNTYEYKLKKKGTIIKLNNLKRKKFLPDN